MTKRLIIALCVFAFAGPAQARFTPSHSVRGLMKKIHCSYSGHVSETSPSTPDFDGIDATNAVCDPLSGESSNAPDQGLLGRLILRTPVMGTRVNSVLSYLEQGQWLDQKVYFSRVNVPTHDFTQGFTSLDGRQLTDENGQLLTENFAIEYTSVLKLGPQDKAGDYELALLSDDGARFYYQENGAWKELINNDGNHATRMGCAEHTLKLTADSAVPIKIVYFQGAGRSLANVLLWRRIHRAQNGAHAWRPECGLTGDRLFYNQGRPTFTSRLLAFAGWKTVAAGNFRMPEQTSNPCVVPDLTLTDFKIDSQQSDGATLSWTTNMPASSQLIITNMFTGEQLTTPLDGNLVTSHSVNVTGLISGNIYGIKAVSTDAQGRSVTSDSLSLTP